MKEQPLSNKTVLWREIEIKWEVHTEAGDKNEEKNIKPMCGNQRMI